MKITSPIKGYSETTEVGPYTLSFKDGVAEVENLNDGAKAWLKANGYGVGSTKAKRPDDPTPEPTDPRKVTVEQVGTPTRDGAVDPAKGDFLGPVNAGEANPHGSQVVNPEIHASEGVRPVKGGAVHVDDATAQDEAEKAHAAAATDGTAVVVTEAEEEDRQEPLPANPNPEPPSGDGDGDGDTASTVDLKGQALDDALEAAGLTKTGTADEKRQRLADHQAQA